MDYTYVRTYVKFQFTFSRRGESNLRSLFSISTFVGLHMNRGNVYLLRSDISVVLVAGYSGISGANNLLIN